MVLSVTVKMQNSKHSLKTNASFVNDPMKQSFNGWHLLEVVDDNDPDNMMAFALCSKRQNIDGYKPCYWR